MVRLGMMDIKCILHAVQGVIFDTGQSLTHQPVQGSFFLGLKLRKIVYWTNKSISFLYIYNIYIQANERRTCIIKI